MRDRAAPPVLSATGAGFRADGHVLVDRVDLDAAAGELLAVVGPNGAGKTTLLSLLAGDLTPTAGTVRLYGRPAGSYRPLELALLRAVMPQQTLLQFAFTAAEVVAMGRSPHATLAADDDRMVRETLSRTAARGLAARRVTTLSGGERSRVTLARVLAQDTPVVLLDEPTTSLDIGHQELVLRVARALAGDGRTVVAVLHDLNLAAAYADRVAVLDGGRLTAVGPPAATLTEPILTRAFACPLRVVPHPFRDCPLVLPADPLPSCDHTR